MGGYPERLDISGLGILSSKHKLSLPKGKGLLSMLTGKGKDILIMGTSLLGLIPNEEAK